MSDEEKKAIEDLKKKYTTEYLDDYEVKFMINYIEKQDKIIDLMAKKLDYYCFCVGGDCTNKCKEHIKEYFRKKVGEIK